jgi:hypothetical protein
LVVDAQLGQVVGGAIQRDVAPPVPTKRGTIRLVQRHAAAWGAKGARILSLSPGIIDAGTGVLEAGNSP